MGVKLNNFVSVKLTKQTPSYSFDCAVFIPSSPAEYSNSKTYYKGDIVYHNPSNESNKGIYVGIVNTISSADAPDPSNPNWARVNVADFYYFGIPDTFDPNKTYTKGDLAIYDSQTQIFTGINSSNYSSSMSYYPGDIIYYNGVRYKCLFQTTGSFDSLKWEECDRDPLNWITVNQSLVCRIPEGYYSISGYGDNSGSTKDNAKPYSFGLNCCVDTYFKNTNGFLHVLNSLSEQAGMLNIPLDEIVIFTERIDSKVQAITNFSKYYPGIYQKLYFSANPGSTSGDDDNPGLGLKICEDAVESRGLVGAMAAYFANISNKISLNDYSFTEEIVDDKEVSNSNLTISESIATNRNCDVFLSGAVRNIGGNDTQGSDLSNLMNKILLEKDLSNRLFDLLMQKIKYDSSGITSIKTTIASVMQKYINSGYVSREKIWEEDDLYIDGKLLVRKGSSLSNGYALHISFNNQKFSEIYIIFGDSEGIRKININGEIF